MPRLFTGLEVPADVRMRLSMLRGGISGARWIEPDDYHLTLTFVGEVDGATASDLAEELSRVRSDPVSIQLESLDAFVGERPRAIYAKAKAAGGLLRLHDQQERALRRAGVGCDRRKFTPHITLARLRAASTLAVADFLGSRTIEPLSFTATRFVLFSSRASTGGGPYLVEAEYPLDGYGSSTESQ